LLENAFRVEAVLIVECPLVGVAQHLIRFGNPLESLLRGLIARIDVRMVAPGKLAKRPFDVVNRRSGLDIQDDVELVSTHWPANPHPAALPRRPLPEGEGRFLKSRVSGVPLPLREVGARSAAG